MPWGIKKRWRGVLWRLRILKKGGGRGAGGVVAVGADAAGDPGR